MTNLREKLPIYSSLYTEHYKDGPPQIIQYLSPEELVRETHKFMSLFSDENNIPDTMIFLDKSARPLGFIFRNLYASYCHDFPERIPQLIFMDLGQLSSHMPSKEHLKLAYSRYLQPQTTALVIDEASFSGLGLERKMELLSEVFPEIVFKSVVAFSKFPVWYGHPELLGVKDRTLNDFINEAVERVNKSLGSKYSYDEEYGQIPPQIQGKIQQELDIMLGNNSVDLMNFNTDPYKDKKLLTRTWGRIPYTKRSFSGDSPEKDSFISFRKELIQLCGEVLNYENTTL